MNTQTKRNGKIDFLRFCFAIVIFLFHARKRSNLEFMITEHLSFFEHGRLGVEFFFLVSGYYLAVTAYKLINNRNDLNISKETVIFCFKKLYTILPYHLIAFSIMLLSYLFQNQYDSLFDRLWYAIGSIPSSILLIGVGMPYNTIVIGEWYISCMILGGLILFPLVLKYQKTFSRLICPIMSMLIMGSYIRQIGYLGGSEWLFNNTISNDLLRAVGEMSCGIFIYEVVQFYRKCNFENKPTKLFVTFIELFLYILCFFLVFVNLDEAEAYFLLCAVLVLPFSFAKVGYTGTLFDNKISYFLGKISIRVFLGQCFVFRFFKITNILDSYNVTERLLITLFAMVIVVVFMSLLYKPVKRLIDGFINKVFPQDLSSQIVK